MCITPLKGSTIEWVSEYKYLGIWLDEKLTLNLHIDNLVARSRQKIGFLFRNRCNFPIFCRKRIIVAVVFSALDYGDVVYRHASATSLKALDAVYHSALRFIMEEANNTHHGTLCEEVEWISISARRDLHLFLFIYEALLGKLPAYITSLINWYSSPYQTQAGRLALKTLQVRTELGKTAFSLYAPSAWNTLQHQLGINTLVPYNLFKTLLKDHSRNCFI